MKIIVKTQFEDFHLWENAPEEVAFLRNLHRHVFYVEVECFVTHDDRELEFFMVRRKIDDFIKSDIKSMAPQKSCEMMALRIKEHLQGLYGRDFIVRVFEDNENGVEV